jgi:hypothetical protein
VLFRTFVKVKSNQNEATNWVWVWQRAWSSAASTNQLEGHVASKLK